MPRRREALESVAALYLPTVVLGELYYGAFRSAYREKQFEQVRRFLQAVIILGTDALCRHGLPIATRDQHFGRIAGIDVRFW